MKKKLSTISLVSTLVLSMGLLLTGCGSDSTTKADATVESDVTVESEEATSEATDESTEETKKVLRVGMECAYAPFNWTQSSIEVPNGDSAIQIYGTKDFAYGYDVMIAQQIADELGWELEIHRVDWSSLVLGMNSGDYDAIIAGMGYTEERDNSVDFTQPYYIRNNVLIVKADSAYANATSIAEFDGASATTQLGTTWEQYVPQIPNVDQQTFFETTSEIVMAVVTGASDCAVLDEPSAVSAVIANPTLKVVKFPAGAGFTVPEGQSLDVCIAVKEGDAELKDALDAALTTIDWTEDKMTELMDLAITLQPLSE